MRAKSLKKRIWKVLITKCDFNFGFDSDACKTCGGACCTGESGYIWIKKSEILALCEHLNLDVQEFAENYLRKVGYRFSLREKPYNGGFACVFFDEEKRNCSVYEFRPTQCRTFPFWDYFKENLEELERECKAIKRI